VKKLHLFGFISLLLISLMAWGIGPVMAQDTQIDRQGYSYQSTEKPLIVTINGLGKGEEVTLVLTPEVDTQKELRTVSIQGSGNSLTAEISADLKDGTYFLLLKAPEQYFRDPKGYSFNIRNSEVMIPTDYSLVFNLEVKSVESMKGVKSTAPPTSFAPPIVLERIVNFSVPPRRTGERDTGYHYVGPSNQQSNGGIWGRFDVVDPDVDHSGSYEHVCQRAMASNSACTIWMEIGWVEKYDEANTRYMYQWDSNDGSWNDIYDLPTGDTLEVAVVHIDDSTDWYAAYKDGDTWYTIDTEDLDVSSMDKVDLQAEIYTLNATHPDLPESDNDLGYIYLSGDWSQWNWQRWATTTTSEDSPYECDYSTVYYDFCVHTED